MTAGLVLEATQLVLKLSRARRRPGAPQERLDALVRRANTRAARRCAWVLHVVGM